ncbi:MAG TPA: ATP-binding protein [Candidatus Ozemobacteraceae bacterium]|nr:ATP-binding protein [Candidatus Ozemobacteraceae bacterium]
MTGPAPKPAEECGLNISPNGLSIHMRIPSEILYLRNALITVKEICDHYDLEVGLSHRIVLALEEALLNTVEHAYLGNPGVIDVLFAVNEEEFKVVVEDYGCGISSKDPEFVEEEPPERGRGLTILRGMADESLVDSTIGQGTRATMLFRMAGARA